MPYLPEIVLVAPSPSVYSPILYERLPPSEISSRTKLMTPAIASEPYCAEAPSLITSTLLSAIAGITEISAPWEPSFTPPP